MSVLQITLFGPVRVTYDNWLTEIKLTKGIQSVLAYLLLQRERLHPRDVLAGVFWGEYSQERARDNLNTALWRLRAVLEPKGIPSGTYLVKNQCCEVGFNTESEYWLDVAVFEEQVSRIMACPFQGADGTNVQELENILRLYKGDLLEGFYEDWALRERERLRALYIEALGYLLQCDIYQGSYARGLSHGQQILDLDPLREEIHREMMHLYLERGQRAQAARQYEICRGVLAVELGIPPMVETQALYQRVLERTGHSRLPAVANEPADLEQALQQLNQATQALELAQAQVQQAIQVVQRCTENHRLLVLHEGHTPQARLEAQFSGLDGKS